ncbi:unnamed protein product, partial [Heterosigma akashiwo]
AVSVCIYCTTKEQIFSGIIPSKPGAVIAQTMYDCGSSMRTSQRSSLRFTLLITVLFCLSCPILSFLGSNFRLTSSSATQGHRLATASGVPLRKILNTRVPGTLGQLYMSSESALTTEEVSKYIEIQMKIKEVEKVREPVQPGAARPRRWRRRRAPATPAGWWSSGAGWTSTRSSTPCRPS